MRSATDPRFSAVPLGLVESLHHALGKVIAAARAEAPRPSVEEMVAKDIAALPDLGPSALKAEAAISESLARQHPECSTFAAYQAATHAEIARRRSAASKPEVVTE